MTGFFQSCRSGDEASDSKVIRTVEQNAPLAVLMREMFVDLQEINGDVIDGEGIQSYLEKHRGILTATATDPHVRDSSFQVMANAYLSHLERIEKSEPEQLLDNYQSLQQSCVACHKQVCPGPIKKINLLKIN